MAVKHPPGETIKKLRVQTLEMTQTAFAEMLGVTQSALSKMERGEVPGPEMIVLIKLLTAQYGCQIDVEDWYPWVKLPS